MKKKELRERIEHLLLEKKVTGVSDIVPLGHPLYQKVYRQLFNNKESDITFDVMDVILEKYPEVSAEWLYRGEGLIERTKIVTNPEQHHHQDIHVEGGLAAITQSGEAKVEALNGITHKESDIADMIRNNDLGGLVAIIMQQKDEIIRLKEQRIRDLETSVRIADNQLFPPVK